MLDRYEDVLRAYEAAPETVRKSDRPLRLYASALVALERPLDADPIYRTLLAAQSLDDDTALEWIRSLARSENTTAEALEAAKSYAEARPSVISRRWLAQTFATNEDFTQALALMETLATENAHQNDLRLDLAEMNNQASRHAEAEAIATKLISEDHDGFRARAALGYSYMHRLWYRQAKAEFEAALKFSPDDEDLKKSLEECSALLGQGKNSSIKEPIQSVEIPSRLAEKLASRKPAPPDPSDHARYLKQLKGFHFVPGKTLRETTLNVIEILDASAIQEFSSLKFGFDPTFERIHPNRLEVFDGKGNRVATGSFDDYYVLDTPDDAADDNKTLHLPVPGLAAGHRIEVEISREYLHPPQIFPFNRRLFGAKLPIVSEAVFLTGETSAIRSTLSSEKTIEILTDGDALIWLGKPSPAFFSENGAPDPEDYNPVLRLTSEAVSWEEAGKNYLGQIQGQMKPAGQTLKDLVEEIAPAKDPAPIRAAAIAAHVQRSISYLAVEFGVRGRMPRSAEDTLRRKQGDCKDQSLLLHRMLASAGIPSSLVLANTVWGVDPKMPTLDQFNHMIVHVPCLSPCPFVDPTSKSARPGELPPFGMAREHVLVLDSEKPYLTRLPAQPDDCASLKITRSVRLLENGGLAVDEHVLFGGYYAEWMRSYLSGMPKKQQLSAIQKILSGFGSHRVDSIEFPDPADPTQKAAMILRYEIPAGPDRDMFPPMVWETDYLNLAFIQRREAPYESTLPIHIESETSISAGKSFSGNFLKALDGSGDSGYCAWTSKCISEAPGKLRLNYQFKTLPKLWPAEDYDKLREAWRASLDASRRKIELEPGP